MSISSSQKKNWKIGIISDTHGVLREAVREVFDGADLIIHAGDIGKPLILSELRAIAPVVAVRGNMDTGPWAYNLPSSKEFSAGSTLIYILHDLNGLDLIPSAAGVRVVVNGHTHRPLIRDEDGVLFINPGSAGPGRGKQGPSVAFLDINGTSFKTRVIHVG